jgi:hypothetical protein
MRALVITTVIVTLLTSLAQADTEHPTAEEASQLKQYDQALACVGLAEVIWQLQKDKSTAAPIKEVAIRIANYAIGLSRGIWSADKVAGMRTQLSTKNQDDVNIMSAILFSQNNDFIQGVMFIQNTQKALAFVQSKIPNDPTRTRTTDETNSLASQAAQQEFDALNCTQIGK